MPEPGHCSFLGGDCTKNLDGHLKVRGDHLLPLHVIAVHASGSGYARDQLFATVNGAIRPNTLAVAGDFNHDLRSSIVDSAKFPALAKWTQQARELPATAISTAKERSPFQAQISKALLPDATTKDFLLLNEARGIVSGNPGTSGVGRSRSWALLQTWALIAIDTHEVWTPFPFDLGTGLMGGLQSRDQRLH